MITDAAVTFGFNYFIAAASPGPNFFVVSHAGLIGPRSAALQTATGVVLGASVLTVLMVSCARWLPQDGRMIAVMDCIFAALLLRYAIQAFGRASSDSVTGAKSRCRHHRFLGQGFITAASNPFTAAFLATAAERDLTPLDAAEIVFVVATLWFGFISLICRHPRMRAFHGQRRRQVETLFGAAFLLMFFRAAANIKF